MSQEVNIRALALDIVSETLENDGFCNVLLGQVLDKYSYLDRRDHAFLSRLVIGTVERAVTLDACIEQFSKLRISKMKPVIRNILRISAYQIYEMDGVSAYAICNEAVELVKKRKQRTFAGFVNGILRSMLRHYEAYEASVKETDADAVSFMKYGRLFPTMSTAQAAGLSPWLYDLLKTQYKEKAETIMDAFYRHDTYGTCIHILGNTRALPETMIKRLLTLGIWTLHPYSEEKTAATDGIYRTQEFDKLIKDALFTEGYAIVQDFSSSMVGRLLPLTAGMKVLDLCAAPGGKTLHIADRIGQETIAGTVLACDLSEEKVKKITENRNRCRKENITTRVWDARVFCPEWKEQFDVVIADVPCSGIGIIGNKPDIKYRLDKTQQSGLASLCELQRSILCQAVSYVRPGGVLIYSTCTLNQGENEEQVRWMMEKFSLEAEEIFCEFPPAYQKSGFCVSNKEGVTLLPEIHSSEGFFVSRLRKRRTK